MSEETRLSKPRQLWQSALRLVKGQNTQELIEAFTSEMTMVAEGLCEDQNKLRASLDDLEQRQSKGENRMDSELQALEQELEENRRDMQQRLDELTERVAEIEAGKRGRFSLGKYLSGGFMNQLTLIVAIAGFSWVLVTILGLFR